MQLPLKNSIDEKEIYTVVQPDIVVIFNESKIDEKGYLRVPDLVSEILSGSTFQKDIHEKYDLYESSSVKEYWIVDLLEHTIQINILNERKKYLRGRLLTRGDRVCSGDFKNLCIDLDLIIPLIVEEPEGAYRRL